MLAELVSHCIVPYHLSSQALLERPVGSLLFVVPVNPGDNRVVQLQLMRLFRL